MSSPRGMNGDAGAQASSHDGSAPKGSKGSAERLKEWSAVESLNQAGRGAEQGMFASHVLLNKILDGSELTEIQLILCIGLSSGQSESRGFTR
ncbi:hypothetical protein M758_12G068600 [Ceratodon purpureus]|nr:hypothetical protein M758_12G068600 [Ceratodon purpureus]